MFFQGSLTEGISTAVRQEKLVLCLVTNDSEESHRWETEYLLESSLAILIEEHAVALKLKAGSEEAGYLSQIFPLPQAPTIVLMKHGELKDYITPGITSEEFHRRLQGAFHAVPPAAATPPPPAPEPPTLSSPQTTASSADGTSPAQPTEAQQSDTVRRVLAERAVRLQEQKLAAEQKIKEDRAKAKEKAEAESKAGKNTQAARTHQQAELVKKRKQQGIDERKRILKRIEDDKEERRAKAAEKDGRATVADVSASLTKSPETKIPSTTKLGNVTALQVRLFDGSTIRSRFKTAAPLADVRKWVGEDRTDGNMPFAFKQVVSPQANKLLDVTEEKKSLGDLALAPSATLVLIPVAKYTQAYQVGNGNILSQLIAMFIAVINWIGGLVGLGARPDAARASQSQEQELDDLNSQGRRRVPQNSNDRRDQQLYNGNSLNFEPRPEDEDK